MSEFLKLMTISFVSTFRHIWNGLKLSERFKILRFSFWNCLKDLRLIWNILKGFQKGVLNPKHYRIVQKTAKICWIYLPCRSIGETRWAVALLHFLKLWEESVDIQLLGYVALMGSKPTSILGLWYGVPLCRILSTSTPSLNPRGRKLTRIHGDDREKDWNNSHAQERWEPFVSKLWWVLPRHPIWHGESWDGTSTRTLACCARNVPFMVPSPFEGDLGLGVSWESLLVSLVTPSVTATSFWDWASPVSDVRVPPSSWLELLPRPNFCRFKTVRVEWLTSNSLGLVDLLGEEAILFGLLVEIWKCAAGVEHPEHPT
jgi:hypothetical protein